MDNDDSPMSTRCRNTPFPDKQLLHPHHPPLTEPLGMLLDVEISDWTRWDRLRNVGTLGPPVQHTKNRSFAAPILGQTLWSEQPPKRSICVKIDQNTGKVPIENPPFADDFSIATFDDQPWTARRLPSCCQVGVRSRWRCCLGTGKATFQRMLTARCSAIFVCRVSTEFQHLP